MLIVDDDDAIRTLFGTTFEVDGWTVRTAVDGRDALDAMYDRTPDLVILDMMMPGVAGLEVLQAMFASPVLQDVPRIVCSARDHPTDREVARTFGASRWLVKPVTPEALLAAVEEALG